VDITAVEARKRTACFAHASQQPEKWYALEAELTRLHGTQSGYTHAEGFLKHWESKAGALLNHAHAIHGVTRIPRQRPRLTLPVFQKSFCMRVSTLRPMKPRQFPPLARTISPAAATRVQNKAVRLRASTAVMSTNSAGVNIIVSSAMS